MVWDANGKDTGGQGSTRQILVLGMQGHHALSRSISSALEQFVPLPPRSTSASLSSGQVKLSRSCKDRTRLRRLEASSHERQLHRMSTKVGAAWEMGVHLGDLDREPLSLLHGLAAVREIQRRPFGGLDSRGPQSQRELDDRVLRGQVQPVLGIPWGQRVRGQRSEEGETEGLQRIRGWWDCEVFGHLLSADGNIFQCIL